MSCRRRSLGRDWFAIKQIFVISVIARSLEMFCVIATRFSSIDASLHQQEALDDGRDTNDANSEPEYGGWKDPGM